MNKQCRKCKEIKDESEFYKRGNGTIKSQCKECEREKQRQRILNNPPAKKYKKLVNPHSNSVIRRIKQGEVILETFTSKEEAIKKQKNFTIFASKYKIKIKTRCYTCLPFSPNGEILYLIKAVMVA